MKRERDDVHSSNLSVELIRRHVRPAFMLLTTPLEVPAP